MGRIIKVLIPALLFGLLFMPIYSSATPSGTVDELFDDPNATEQDKTNNDTSESNQEKQPSPAEKPGIKNGSSTNIIGVMIRVIVALAIVVGLIYLLIKFLNKKNKISQSSAALKNLGGLPLGTNKSVQIIRIGERLFVVGVGENIELLTEIEDEDTKERLLNQKASDNTVVNPQLSKLLGDTFGKLTKKNKNDKESSSGSFSNLFESELKSLKDKRNKITNSYKRKEEDKHE